jgi:hypothetical protein
MPVRRPHDENDVRFDAKRVISLCWNEDVADDRVVAFATTHNWAPSDWVDFETSPRLSGRVGTLAMLNNLFEAAAIFL